MVVQWSSGIVLGVGCVAITDVTLELGVWNLVWGSYIAIVCEILIVSKQLQTWRRCEFFRYNLTNLIGTECVFKKYVQWKVHIRMSVLMWWRHVGGVEVRLHLILTSIQHGDEWPASCPGPSTAVHAQQKDVWVPNLVWTYRRTHKLSSSGCIKLGPQPSHCTDWIALSWARSLVIVPTELH
jgi:hypothetical protein